MDKTLTNIGQKLDKTWTFVKKLSKFCLTYHSRGAPATETENSENLKMNKM